MKFYKLWRGGRVASAKGRIRLRRRRHHTANVAGRKNPRGFCAKGASASGGES